MSIKVGPGGICFAHGPYTDMECPDHDCSEIILANGPNPEYVALAENRVYRNNKVYSQAELDEARIESRKEALKAAEKIALEYGKNRIYTAQSAGIVLAVKTDIAKFIKMFRIREA